MIPAAPKAGMKALNSCSFRVRGVRIDPATREVHRGSESIVIEPRVFDFLVHLVEHRDRLVTKAELLDQVWGSRILSESVIARAASEARRVVGSSSIKTVYGRGYRFVGVVEFGDVDVGNRHPAWSEIPQSGESFAASHTIESIGGEHIPSSVVYGRRGEEIPPSALRAFSAFTAAWDFVGRRDEIALIRDRLRRAVGGEGGLVVVTGDPGIGKTALLESAGVLAATMDFDVRWVQCARASELPDLWPWEQLSRIFSPCAEGSSAFTRFEELRARLRGEDREGALLLVLDDFHLADPASVAFLEFFTRTIQRETVLVLVACREVACPSGAERTSGLSRLGRMPRVSLLELDALLPGDVTTLLNGRVHPPVLEATAVSLHEATAGNAFFLTCLVGLLERGFVEPGRVSLERLTPEVCEAVAEQLHGVSSDCLRALTMASVLGRHFDPGAIAMSLEMELPRVHILLDEACAWRLVREARGEVGLLEFTHAVVRAALYQRMTPHQRSESHHRVGAALEELYPHRDDAHHEVILGHYMKGIRVDGGARALERCLAAAARAQGGASHVEAVRYLRQAVSIMDASPNADPDRLANTLLDLGIALAHQGEQGAARPIFVRAAKLCHSLGASHLLARVAPEFENGIGFAACQGHPLTHPHVHWSGLHSK